MVAVSVPDTYLFNTLKLLSIADARFASVIVMLKMFKKIRRGLQAMVIDDKWSLEPREWWIMYGSSAPLLQNLALKLLSQPCSSSCCERNWSTYSFIHSVRRNKITPKRAEDLVFVHTNLRLLSRQSSKYKEGETKMWDIGGDRWEHFDGLGTLEVASLSLDEPELEADLLVADEGENDEIPIVEV
ncbi:Dimer_Tnp_hAT domain-containing protein [Senna tora]|uniref:Dimer_Tnp_hAT domain-containing protein n=1 Tax=Senna tora TaxID=362788 RepID=A0A834T041_9FABA|nr:Dimer_Tnp_hAT domain-containing protein [Senna tora]